MAYVGEFLDMAYIRVLEVATFYTMFNLAPVGATTCSSAARRRACCAVPKTWKAICRDPIGDHFHVTDDGMLSWVEVECLGACRESQIVQFNYNFYEDLTPESFNRILDDLAAGKAVKPGPRSRSPAVRAVRRVHNFERSVDLSDQRRPRRRNAHAVAVPRPFALAKKPSQGGNVREMPAPKPPAADASTQQRPGTRRE